MKQEPSSISLWSLKSFIYLENKSYPILFAKRYCVSPTIKMKLIYVRKKEYASVVVLSVVLNLVNTGVHTFLSCDVIRIWDVGSFEE